MEIILGALFVFCARVIDVSMGTVRMILTIRGRRRQAAFIGFFEVIIYVSVLSMVVQSLDKWFNLVAYGLGYACGILVGSKIEEWLALGYVTIQAIVKEIDAEMLVCSLRAEGYGVTTFDAYGLEGPKKMLNIFALRKNLGQITKIIQAGHRETFITVLDARSTLGGYIKQVKKK